MRRSRPLLLFLATTLLLLSTGFSNAASQLHVTVSTDKQSYGPTEIVSVTGRVFDNSQTGVPFASVSIQANDPSGDPIHVAFVLSSADGTYTDQFTTPSSPANGGYTVYVTVSKPGYADASAQATCIVTPEFPMSHVPWLMLIPTVVFLLLSRGRQEAL